MNESPGAIRGIGDAEFAELAALADVERLSIYGGSISDVGFAHLAEMNKLKSVSLLECSKLRGSNLAPLATLEHLESLDITRVSAGGVATIGKIGSLRELELVLGNLQPADVAPLADLSMSGRSRSTAPSVCLGWKNAGRKWGRTKSPWATRSRGLPVR